MKVAYITEYDARDIGKWSGTGHYIAESLKNQSIDLSYIGPLKDRLSHKLIRKYKRHYYDFFNHYYLKDPEPHILKSFAKQIECKLHASKANIVFSATTNTVAYLECEQPIVFWADATFAGLKDFYPQYSNLCCETVQNWHLMESLALRRSELAIYSSEWAAKTAIEFYGTNPNKVKVVPFGANINTNRSLERVADSIESRSKSKCKLLFIGVDWIRKGGNIVYEVAKKLNQLGQPTELTVVGCEPILEEPVPKYIKLVGFISKASKEGRQRISQLISEAHFLIVPSQAECYGIVFCEANSLGVPCISTKVGGIPTIIKDNINGKLFDSDADIEQYSTYISNLFFNYSEYKEIAYSSFKEYNSRLNWNTSGQIIKELLSTIYK